MLSPEVHRKVEGAYSPLREMKGQDGLLLFADKENSTGELAAFPLNLTQLYRLPVGMSSSGGAVACKGRAPHRLHAFSVSPFYSEPLPTVVQWHLVIESPANTLAGKSLFHSVTLTSALISQSR